MKYILTLFLLTCVAMLQAQVHYGSRWSGLPTKTVSLNDFGAKGDDSPGDAAIIKSVLRLADQKGWRVTGYGTFNFNGDSAMLNNVHLWADNKGTFILRNGGFLTPKKSFKATNVIFNDWSATTSKGICFWDTVNNASGTIITDGWPEKYFVLQIDNCDFDNMGNAFYCQQDPSPDSSSLFNSYIRRSTFTNFKYSAIKLPFAHYGLLIEKNYFSGVLNGGINFSAIVNIGLDNANRYTSTGLQILNNYAYNIKADTVEATTYGFLAYTNGGLWQGNQFKEVGAPAIYMNGDNNTAFKNIIINDTVKAKHGIIIKGGQTAFKGFTDVSSNTVKGKFLTAIYMDHRGDKAQLYNNQVVVDYDPYNVGEGGIRIISHGFNSIDIAGGSIENKQTDDNTHAIKLTTDDTLYNFSISGATILSDANGISMNSEMIKSFEVHDNPVIYAATDHTFKTGGTKVSKNTIYYNPGATYTIGLNSKSPIYIEDNTFKPYFKSFSTTPVGRIFQVSNDTATENTYYYFSGNKYDLSAAQVAFYVENPVYLRFRNEQVTAAAASTTNFINIRGFATMMDVEANNVDIPFGKQFIVNGMDGAGEHVKLKIFNSTLSGSVISFTGATQADLSKDTLLIENSKLPSTLTVGTGWLVRKTPGIPSDNITTITGNYTIASSAVKQGQSNIITGNSATAITVTVPPASSTYLPIGAVVDIYQIGAGVVNVAGGSGVTINAPATLSTTSQYNKISLVQVATNTWYATVPVAASSGAGSGDFSTNTATSVDGEMMLFSGTSGKLGKRSTLTGFIKSTSGVPSAVSSINLETDVSGSLPFTSLNISGTRDATTVLYGDGVLRTAPTGSGGSTDTIYFDRINSFDGAANIPGDPLTLKHPGGSGAVAIKENITIVTTASYVITPTDVNLIFSGTASGTWTLPAFNSVNHKRVLYISNPTAYAILLDKPLYITNGTSYSQIDATSKVKLIVDDTNDKVWRVLVN